MGFTLDNLKYQAVDPGSPDDPDSLVAQCIRDGVRTDNWYGQANHFICPLNIPGTGKILLNRDTLDALDLESGDEFRTLTITDNKGGEVKLAKVLIVGHEVAVTTGAAESSTTDPNMVYLVSIADPRWLYFDRGMPKTKAYNLRGDDDGKYITSTLNSAAAWTWQQLLDDLWPSGLGTSPTLPFAPDGTPEGFWFKEYYPLNAYLYVLKRLCIGLKYDPVADDYELLRLGNTSDATYTAWQAVVASPLHYRRHDTYSVTTRTANYPEKLRVDFRVKYPYTDGTEPYYTVDKNVTPSAATINAGTFLSIQDDLHALWNGTSITNSSALDTRATERADHWTAKRQYHDIGLYCEYLDIIDFTSILGTPIEVISWQDVGDGAGAITAVKSGKNSERWLEDWERREYVGAKTFDAGVYGSPLIMGGAGAGGGGSDCCDPEAILGGDITGCCPSMLGGGDGGGGIGGGGPKCCNAALYYFCANKTEIAFRFQVCNDNKATFLGFGGVIGVGGPGDVAGSAFLEGGTSCGWAAQDQNKIAQLLAMIPGGADSYCPAGGGIGGGGVGNCPPGYFPHPQFPNLCCSDPWQQVFNADGSTRWICTGQVVNTNAKTGASGAASSSGCSNCGGVANSAYAPPNPSCGCHDEKPSTTQTAALGGQMLGGTGLGGATITDYLLSQVGAVPAGVPTIVAKNNLAGQAATLTITTWTVGASDGSFFVTAYLNVIAITGNIKLQVQWFDETNTSSSADMNVAVTVAGRVTVSPVCIRAFAGSAINVVTTGAIVSVNYNAGANIIQTE